MRISGAPGEPCPVCDRTDADTVPEPPDGFVVDPKSEDGNNDKEAAN
jgi:hypothetical protein